MNEPLRGNGSPTVAILHVLDQALLRHLERITGTRHGIQGLPMDLMTVTCIVLLTERSEEVAEAGSERRLSRSELEDELSEMGLGDPSMLDQTLERMAEADYLEVDAQQRLVPGKPTFSMARLLDHAFSGMPGMNLVAYFVQTLDEVETGRKDAADALRQLDQMLRRHGAAPFHRQATAQRGAKTAAPVTSTPSRPESAFRPSRIKAPKRGTRPFPPKENRLVFRSPGKKPPSLDAESEGRETLTLDHDTAPPLEPVEPPSPSNGIEPVPSPSEMEVKPTQAADSTGETETGPSEPNLSSEPNAVAESGPLQEPEDRPDSLPERPQDTEEGIETHPVEESAPVFSEPDALFRMTSTDDPSSQEAVDDGVEDRIASFENTLAMECPVCRQASVEVRETAKGRVYYQCASDQCMFISWGRPHHVPCPWCGNPFLVESATGNGETLLKCPRATCRYTSQKETDAPPKKPGSTGDGASIPTVRKKKRRVVKRRVVRRKR